MDVIDTVMDRTLLPGYSKIGLSVRERLPGWPADPPRMDGKVVLVTGAAGGLGLAAARGFAALGARVLAHGRSEERAAEAAAKIAGSEPVWCDLSSLEEVKAFCDRLLAAEERLDVLVNNAGVMPDERETTVDGLELQFATHVLAPWVLIDRLRPLLEAADVGRVIIVSSGGMYAEGLPAGDLDNARSEYKGRRMYARTKREQIVLAEQWAQELRGTGVVVHSMHPGWADTEGVQRWLPAFRTAIRTVIRSPEQGADTIVWLGGAPEPTQSTGRFWHDRRPRPTHYLIGAGPDDVAVRDALWRRCSELAA